MVNYIIRRIGYGVLILIGVNVFTFLLFFTVNTPDDMARMNIGGKRVSQDAIEKWKVERGYDKPLFWNSAAPGTQKLTKTIFYDRSVQLFRVRFRRLRQRPRHRLRDSQARGPVARARDPDVHSWASSS
jgi:peptide/nickel transport system permease protein